MSNRYRIINLIVGFAIMGLVSIVCTDFCRATDIALQALEEQGIELNIGTSDGNSPQPVILDSLPMQDVLLIPESNADNVGVYDPFDGTFLGIFITGYSGFQTPINAVPGPDGNIYVSDQVADAVFVFDRGGNYLYTYADATDGLNNIRGIAFRERNLYVTSGDDYVAEFAGPHDRQTDFINDGSDSFDIFFLPDGRALLSHIGTGANVRLYSASGTYERPVIAVNFPEQISADTLLPGDFLNASFSSNVVSDFDLNGSVYQTTSWNQGRGCYRLGNGNLLLTSGNGVFEVTPGGGIVQQENTGGARFIELCRPIETGIGDNQGKPPADFALAQNYPNPFNASTVIAYNLGMAGQVRFAVYDLLGNLVEVLIDQQQSAGRHEIVWNADRYPSGIYFGKLQTANSVAAIKMVLAK